MKWKKAAAVMLAAALTAAASAGTLSWDFSDRIGGEWKLFKHFLPGDQEDLPWIVKDRALQHSDDTKWGVALVGEENWNDYVVEARIRIDETREHAPASLVFAVRFLSDHQFSCYQFTYSPENNLVYLGRLQAEDRRALTSREVSENPPALNIGIGKWFHIRAHVEDGRFRCYINDILTFDKKDAAYNGQGQIGFSAKYSVASFDDLTVTGPNIEDLLAVDPEGSMAAQWAELKRN